MRSLEEHLGARCTLWPIALILLGLGIPCHAQDSPGRSPSALIEAVKAGQIGVVRDLLNQGAPVDGRWGDGSSALHWAAHDDDLALLDLLIDAGADVNTSDDHGVTALTLACLNGSVQAVTRLLDAGADPNQARTTGVTPLMTAARVGSVEVVRLLLTRGADVNAREDTRHQTALMWAIAENHTVVARVLIDAGASVSARTTLGFTPLLFAAQQGNIEAAQILLDAGAQVSESAPDGIGGDTNARVPYRPDTEAQALLVAIDSGHATMTRFLLEQGADPNHTGAGRAPLHSAVQQRMPDVVKLLLAHGADPNARLTRRLPLLSRFIQLDNGLTPTPLGATPFWLAASFADTEIMRLLVQSGANPLLESNDGTTPLMVAAGADFVEGQDKYGRRWFGDATPLQEAAIDAVELCLELGADINATNENGQTALHGAVYFGGTILVPVLVEHGANINAINLRGQTPWLIAARGEYRAGSFYTHQETAEVLEHLGADTSLGFDLGKDFRTVLAAQDPVTRTSTTSDAPIRRDDRVERR